MVEERVVSSRLTRLLLALVAWFSLASAVFAVSIDSVLNAIITGLIGIAAIGIVVNGRIVKASQLRPLTGGTMVILALLAAAVIVFEIGNLRTWDLIILGKVRIPSVIRSVKAIGSILLSLGVLWELIRLLRVKR